MAVSYSYNIELQLKISFLPQGVIFVVDSNDRERIQEAREELERMVCLIFGMHVVYTHIALD